MTKPTLTPPQYEALAKWRSGKPENETALRVRSDVYDRLRKDGHLRPVALLMRCITEKGQAALADYEARKRP